VEALKEKLTYLYENQNICKQMGQSAKEMVSKGFTWDDYGEKISAEYSRIFLNQRRAHEQHISADIRVEGHRLSR
jgi:glycosyltransferase involved in cell wall biosynthesis